MWPFQNVTVVWEVPPFKYFFVDCGFRVWTVSSHSVVDIFDHFSLAWTIYTRRNWQTHFAVSELCHLSCGFWVRISVVGLRWFNR